MLVEADDPAELVGYVTPAFDHAGFVVAIFQRRSTNHLSVQEIGADGRIAAFRDVMPTRIEPLAGQAAKLAVGDPALWGFRDQEGAAHFADEAGLKTWLAHRADNGADTAFLRLQIAQFCDHEADTIGAWRDAFQLLGHRSPRSAAAWRDVVVIPAQLRLAVEQAVLRHGLDASIDHLDRAVAVQVAGNRMRVSLNAELHAALVNHDAALATLERNVDPIRQAFDLSSEAVRLARLEEPAATPETEPTHWDGISVVAFGAMAAGFMKAIMPGHVAVANRRQDRFSLEPPVEQLVLFQDGRLVHEGPFVEPDQLSPAGDLGETLLIFFELSIHWRSPLDAALTFAQRALREGRTVIAVIPHLPEALGEDPRECDEIVAALEKSFDAIWLLSDRSPYLRQTLPYGPARSVKAAATNFHLLHRMIAAGEATWTGDRNGGGSKISVIAAAYGDRATPRLIKHALMRLAQPCLDLARAGVAQILLQRVGGFDQRGTEQILRSEAPHARPQYHRLPPSRHGPGDVAVILRGIGLRSIDAHSFEAFCVQALERRGWRVVPSNAEPGFAGEDPSDLPVRIGMSFADPPSDGALRTRRKRGYIDDILLVTNATVRRRSFALQLFSGAVPVHCSRLDVAAQIYRNRYAYGLRTIAGEPALALGLLVPAAVDIINRRLQKAAPDIWKAYGVALLDEEGGSPQLDVTPDVAWVSMALRFDARKGPRGVRRTGRASVRLIRDGWSIRSLIIEDRAIDLLGPVDPRMEP